MSQQSLGDKLKELRESKGLSREQLYSQTKILVRYIEALEEGRWDLLPGKAYLKPFVKNIAVALGADYREYYEMIESHEDDKELPQPEQSSKRFDYRWLALALMIGLVAVIVYVLKPMSNDEEPEEVAESIVTVAEPENNHAILERDYSSNLDIANKLLDGKTLHRIQITAIDSAWVVLSSDTDTLYAGMMVSGRQIVRESIKPFILFMGKANTLNIRYNDVDLTGDERLRNRRRINFGEFELRPNSQPGVSGEGL